MLFTGDALYENIIRRSKFHGVKTKKNSQDTNTY